MNWSVVQLGEICQTSSGGKPLLARNEYFGGKIPWVKSGDLTDSDIVSCEENITEIGLKNSSAKVFKEGTVLIAMYGATVGKLGILGMDAATNQAVCGITPPEKLDRKFLFYFLLKNRQMLIEMSTGGAQPNISQKIIRNIAIPLPPLHTQRRIVNILSRAEGIVLLRREAQKKAAEIIPALFIDMFGDPATNPRGWPVALLGEVLAEPPILGTMAKPSVEIGRWLDLRVANIQGGQLKLEDKKWVLLPEEQCSRYSLHDGDIVLARAIGSLDHLGKAVVVYPGVDEWTFDSHLMRVRLDRTLLLPEVLKGFLESNGGRKSFLTHTRHSVVQFNINGKELRKISIPLPPVFLQSEYIELVKIIHSIQSQQSAATQKAEAAFNALLSRAFQGELLASETT